jgi:thiol-disulfide isomerase/thioredoxin
MTEVSHTVPDTVTVSSATVDWSRPVLSDFSCDRRLLEPVEPGLVAYMSGLVNHQFDSDPEMKPQAPLHVEHAGQFDALLSAQPERLFVVDFHATWCGPCTALAQLFRFLALNTPICTFLKVCSLFRHVAHL